MVTCTTQPRTYRIIPAKEVEPTDKVFPSDLRPCTVKVGNDGIYQYHETTQASNFFVYHRGDPRANEAALREALPALYLSFQARTLKK